MKRDEKAGALEREKTNYFLEIETILSGSSGNWNDQQTVVGNSDCSMLDCS